MRGQLWGRAAPNARGLFRHGRFDVQAQNAQVATNPTRGASISEFSISSVPYLAARHIGSSEPEGAIKMAGAGVHEVNDSTFEQEVLQSAQPVLVDFWAAWCGPCKALAPIVDEVATEYSGKLKVMKMDVDRNSATPMRYGIRGIPALLLFKDGKLADQIVGYVPKDTIARSVDNLVGD
jgi:thioredoxin 1